MWVSDDGRLNTAALPLASIEHLMPSPSRRVALAERLTDLDPWRDGGLAESIINEVGESQIDPDAESDFTGQTLPDIVLIGFHWENLTDVPSAENELAHVPLRWRLDMANVIEDLIDLFE